MLDNSARKAPPTESSIGKATMGEPLPPAPDSYDIERRADGVLLVRVHSVDRQGRKLPDAVFTFRNGDPQYEYWERQAKRKSST